ncbi:MAG TPA: 5'-nucleotidase, lipoprotein e(P4) family [Pyrinomonadaceae bacterium]|nr:5'-nucleotidase, lipoprotein e(P4) family [Pyrinomonadaceae bacterium]
MNFINQWGVRRTWLKVMLLAIVSSSATFAQTAAPAEQKQADNVYQEGAILWTQTSGEVRALAYQAFNLARMMLDRDLQSNRRSRMRRAVVVDADETVLDNSRYQATLQKNRQNYDSRTWTEWVKRVEAEAVPGAVEFLRYAASRGVRVFYITNRNLVEREATAENLKKLGFPNVSDQTLLVRTDAKTSSKEPRRQSVSSKYRIVLLMGDNLNDFAEVFEQSKTVADRLAAVERNKAEFGKRFIVLPNAMYGDWESAIYDYNFKLTDEEKAAKRKSRLKTY